MTSKRLLTPIARVLLDAADFIEEHGWCQNVLVEGDGSVCLNGAIVNSVRPHTISWILLSPEESKLAHAAVDKVQEYLGVGFSHQWNNVPGRSKEEVVHALRQAAIS